MIAIVDRNDSVLDCLSKLADDRFVAKRIELAARINRNLVAIQRDEKNRILSTKIQYIDKYATATDVTKMMLMNN